MGISWCMWGISWVPWGYSNNKRFPPQYWTPSTVLTISPTCIMTSLTVLSVPTILKITPWYSWYPYGTEHPHSIQDIHHIYHYIPTVLNTLHSTDHPWGTILSSEWPWSCLFDNDWWNKGAQGGTSIWGVHGGVPRVRVILSRKNSEKGMSIFHKNSGKGYNICKKFLIGSVILMT